jgi:hypothetical protein
MRHPSSVEHVTLPALEHGLAEIRRSPKETGTVELIVRRPAENDREMLDQANLDPLEGLIGDCWRARGSGGTANGSAHPDRQLTLMNARAAALVARVRERWPLAGDQLYVDFDLSVVNLPPGTRLDVGSAVIEVTAEPHHGCGKFARRFGVDAQRFVNSAVGRQLNLRGVNAKILSAGTVQTGDVIRKL